MRTEIRTIALVAAVLCSGCSGSGGGETPAGSAGPSGPSGPSAPGPQSGGDSPITINILGIRGPESFSPNPATVPDGRLVVWRNTDTLVHRVVFDDRSVDTGDIAPGAASAPMALGGVKPYHCPLHPSMVGRINGDAPDSGSGSEPCSDPSCYY